MKSKIRFNLTLSLLLIAIGGLSAQSRQTRQEYVERYKHIAIAHMEKYGIPASITMAQGILESNSGNSELSTSSNNHFGIKCKSGWSGRKVYYDDDAKGECFRAYRSVEASYEDHAIFLDSSPRYDSLFAYSTTDYKSWARGLKAAGYATAPHYATMLVKIIEDEKLYLLDRKNGAKLYAKRHEIDLPADKVVEVELESTLEVDPDNFAVTINAHKGYNVERCNGLYYTRAKVGDTVEELSEVFEISKHNLRRFNDLKRGDGIEEGDAIYIERKLPQWQGGDKESHQVTEGESLHTLSQRYGVRQNSLRRLNSLKRRDEVSIGQIIKLK